MSPRSDEPAAENSPSRTAKNAVTNETSGAADAMPAVVLDWQAQAHSLACRAPPAWWCPALADTACSERQAAAATERVKYTAISAPASGVSHRFI